MANRVAAAAESAGAEVRVRPRRRNPGPGVVRPQSGLDGELRSHQGSAGRHRRRHRVGRRRDLRLTDSVRLARSAVAHLHRLARRAVVRRQAGRQGVCGLYVLQHPARRPGNHPGRAVHHADPLGRHHRAAGLHRSVQVRRRQSVWGEPGRHPRQHHRVRRSHPQRPGPPSPPGGHGRRPPRRRTSSSRTSLTATRRKSPSAVRPRARPSR